MEFKHIEYFIETANHKSISKAAEALFISQQALSRCIQNLEAELNCKLFERTVKGSVLTKDGKLIYDKFLPVVEQYRNTEEEIFTTLNSRATPRRKYLLRSTAVRRHFLSSVCRQSFGFLIRSCCLSSRSCTRISLLTVWKCPDLMSIITSKRTVNTLESLPSPKIVTECDSSIFQSKHSL